MEIRTDNLVSEFFEKMSWEFLENYRDIINGMIKSKAGIYALYKGDRLYYVGLAVNLKRRLTQHLKDRHKGRWSHFSVYLVTEDDHIKPLESLVLRIADPVGNAVKGKLPGATNMRKSIVQQMKARDADVRSKMVGGSAVKRRLPEKEKVVRAKSVGVEIDRSHALKATYKGQPFKATLRKDRKISFDGNLYSSPTAAAKAVINSGGSINGRAFWKYKNEAGEWVALSKLIG